MFPNIQKGHVLYKNVPKYLEIMQINKKGGCLTFVILLGYLKLRAYQCH